MDVGRFHYRSGSIAGVEATFCRTGYTGEDGFELILPAESAETVWNALTAAGAAPCGLGARVALSIEAGYPLYGHEIDDTTTPVEALLMWAVSMTKWVILLGRDRIAAVKAEGPTRKLMGLVSAGKRESQPRQGYTVLVDGGMPAAAKLRAVFSHQRWGTALRWATFPQCMQGSPA